MHALVEKQEQIVAALQEFVLKQVNAPQVAREASQALAINVDKLRTLAEAYHGREVGKYVDSTGQEKPVIAGGELAA